MESTGGKFRVSLSWLFIVWERAWRAMWPAGAVLGVATALGLFDIAAHIPAGVHVAALLFGTIALLFALWRGWRRFRMPTGHHAVRRLQRINGLSHRPIEALSDEIATGMNDSQSEALWRIHRERMKAQIANLKVGLPQPRLIRLDAFGLRVGIGVLLIAGLGAAGGEAQNRIVRALKPQLAIFEPTPPPVVDAWMTPPAYTGVTPVFLTGPDAEPNKFVQVPSGSQLSVRISGSETAPRIIRTREEGVTKKLDKKSHGADLTITESETVSIAIEDETIAEWTIRTTPDELPRAAFLSLPGEGRGNVLRIDFRATDDYGLAEVTAVIVRTKGKSAVPQDGEPKKQKREVLDMPLPKVGAKKAVSISYHDLTPHPWAGLPVQIHLEAKDAAGQIGHSKPVRIILPEREFSHPVAREIVIERRKLTADPRDAALIAATLRDIASQPERFEEDVTVFLALGTAARRLLSNDVLAQVESLQQLLWDTALRVEDGKLSIARRNLRSAEEALRKALEKDTSDRELARLMNELESALDSYLDELSKMMKNIDPKAAQSLPRDNRAMALTRRDLKRMMEEIRRLAQSGSRTDAKRMLSQLKNMLENMRAGQASRMSPQSQKSMKLLNDLQNIIRDQQQLLEDTFRDARRRGQLRDQNGDPRFQRPGERRQGQRRQGEPRWGPQQPGSQTQSEQPGGMPGSAQFQEALRRRLGDIMRQLGDMTNSIPRPMGRAERSMRRSSDFLGSDRPGDAIAPQTRALDQLQESARAATRQLMQRMGQGVGRRPGENGQRQDPFGRTPEGAGGMNTSDIGVKEQDALQRAREIRNELRRRAGQQKRPEAERDYINRLLKQF